MCDICIDKLRLKYKDENAGFIAGLIDGGENPFEPDTVEFESFWDGIVEREKLGLDEK